MKIILLDNIKKQGKKGDIINVKDGYGNFLIKNKQAVLETTGSKKILDNQNKKAKDQAIQLLEKSKELKKQIEKLIIEFKVKVGSNDQVFGSVSTKQIANELKNQGIDIDKRKIKIDTPINILGTTIVKIEIHKEITADLKIILTK